MYSYWDFRIKKNVEYALLVNVMMQKKRYLKIFKLKNLLFNIFKFEKIKSRRLC